MEALKEKTVAWLLVAGLAISIVSALCIAMFTGGGVMHGTATRDPYTNEIRDAGDLNLVPVPFLFFALGIGMMGGGIGYGLWFNANRNKGVRAVVPNVRILARYLISTEGQMLTTEWEVEDAIDATYHVRVQLSPTISTEMECRPETYFASGEGMVGEAEVQGKWLGKFTPYLGVPDNG